MKHLIYLGKTKVWVDGRETSYASGEDLIAIFKQAKDAGKVGEAALVLSNEVSFVTAVRSDKQRLLRPEARRMAAGTVPFVLGDDNFDWRLVKLGEGDFWVQVVAVEPELMVAVLKAIAQSKMKVSWMGPASVLIAKVSEPHETPVLIKWSGVEEFSVLALRGMVDLVSGDSDESVNAYAKARWHLAVNPEQIVLNDKNMDWEGAVEVMKKKGDDAELLGLSAGVRTKDLETLISEGEDLSSAIEDEVEDESPPGETGEPKENPLKKWFLVGVIVMVWVGGIMVVMNMGKQGNAPASRPALKSDSIQSLLPTPIVATTAATPEVRLDGYKVSVLNGSGLAGEAGRVRESLMGMGFVQVDVGNASDNVSLTKISSSAIMPLEVVNMVKDSLVGYSLDSDGVLTAGAEYDLIILVGSTRK